jgi:hypothetical protein
MQQNTFFLDIQAQSTGTYSTSCPENVENSTSPKQTLKTPGKSFTRSKVKKIRDLESMSVFLAEGFPSTTRNFQA